MLSLDKTKSREALRDWLGGNPAILSWKLDGLTIVLTYHEGKLAKAVTRGNGEIGEVITGNAGTFGSVNQVPQFIKRSSPADFDTGIFTVCHTLFGDLEVGVPGCWDQNGIYGRIGNQLAIVVIFGGHSESRFKDLPFQKSDFIIPQIANCGNVDFLFHCGKGCQQSFCPGAESDNADTDFLHNNYAPFALTQSPGTENSVRQEWLLKKKISFDS
jgi:hypothetical protein